MLTIALAARAGRWSPLRPVRAFVATWRERRAEMRRCAVLAAAYRQSAPVELRPRGVYPSHRAVRPVRVRRQATPRAPREARHTPAALGAAARWVTVPPDWYRRGHSWRGRETLFVLTGGRAGACPA